MTYGTLSVLDTLASSQQTIAQYGEDNAWEAIQASLTAHNRVTDEMLATFVETTTDRQRRYGGEDQAILDEVDEYGRADAQKVTAGATVGFPLRRFEASVQWTRLFFENTTAAQLAAQFTAIQSADVRTMQRELKRAIYRAANYSYLDRYVDSITLAVKRLVNADSQPIPLGPNGEVFNAATHTHYLATASLVAANVQNLLETVIEHHSTGQAVLVISRTDETAVRALTGFTAYLDARLVPATNAVNARGTLDNTVLNNRAIGVFSSGGVAAEVWVKPWAIASYLFAYVAGAPQPLVLRRRATGTTGLRVEAENENFPLRARTMGNEYGFGIWHRTNGAVLYTGGGAYTDPTIN